MCISRSYSTSLFLHESCLFCKLCYFASSTLTLYLCCIKEVLKPPTSSVGLTSKIVDLMKDAAYKQGGRGFFWGEGVLKWPIHEYFHVMMTFTSHVTLKLWEVG